MYVHIYICMKVSAPPNEYNELEWMNYAKFYMDIHNNKIKEGSTAGNDDAEAVIMKLQM